ncbi:hypothetical protein HDU93_008599 [Gonapodya sp. JEL0774]|nr:hypothetical protein HDU93_008599 [Gonapodya sp. JEL0774]
MAIHPSLDQNGVPASLMIVGGFTVLFSFVSMIVKERLFISQPLLATACGIIFGPLALNVWNPFSWSDGAWLTVVRQFGACILAIHTLPFTKRWWEENWSTLFVMLLPVSFYMWLATSLLVWGIVGCSLVNALAIGAALTPTDPILANSIVKGRFADMHVSRAVQELLSVESGGNDAVAIPYFSLGLFLVEYYFTKLPASEVEELNHVAEKLSFPHEYFEDHHYSYSSPSNVVLQWFLSGILYEVILAVILGFLFGYGARWLLEKSEERNWIDEESMLAFSIALSLLVLGVADILGLASFFAVFVAGLSFAWDGWFADQTKNTQLQEVIDMLLSTAFFIYFGTTIPFASFNTSELPIWRLLLLSLALLFLRRVPAVVAAYPLLRRLNNRHEAYFVGWFAPIGVGALWYAAYAVEAGAVDPVMIPVVWWMVLTSLVVHGASVPFVHLSILAASRSRDPSFATPRGPAGWTGGRLNISAPILGARPPSLHRPSHDSSGDATRAAKTDDSGDGVLEHSKHGISRFSRASSDAGSVIPPSFIADDLDDDDVPPELLGHGIPFPGRGDTTMSLSLPPLGLHRTFTADEKSVRIDADPTAAEQYPQQGGVFRPYGGRSIRFVDMEDEIPDSQIHGTGLQLVVSGDGGDDGDFDGDVSRGRERWSRSSREMRRNDNTPTRSRNISASRTGSRSVDRTVDRGTQSGWRVLPALRNLFRSRTEDLPATTEGDEEVQPHLEGIMVGGGGVSIVGDGDGDQWNDSATSGAESHLGMGSSNTVVDMGFVSGSGNDSPEMLVPSTPSAPAPTLPQDDDCAGQLNGK